MLASQAGELEQQRLSRFAIKAAYLNLQLANALVPVWQRSLAVSTTLQRDVAAIRARGLASRLESFQAEALKDPLPDGNDVILCSLFLHHLDDDAAVDLLRRMGRASRSLVLVNDLIRSPLGYGDYRSPGHGIAPADADLLIGKTLNSDVASLTPILLEHVE